MQNDPNKPNRIKLLAPVDRHGRGDWAEWAAFAEVTRFRNNSAQARFVG